MLKTELFSGNGQLTRERAVGLLEKMREIRQFQERVISIYPTDVMVTPVHLHTGQEAVPVGVCAHLRQTDTLLLGHRTQGPALAKGMEMKKLMAELYGRTTGCSHGYGGSMHVVDAENGMLGSSSIVGGSIALAVGSALAAKMRNADYISVAWFGDGATDAGVFWESLNFAALNKLPVLLLCEDNGLSNVMPKTEHMFLPTVTSVTEKFMPSFTADGTDVLSVYSAAQTAIDFVRNERKPAYLECKTKRWMKHQGVERDDLPYNPIDPEKDCPIRKLEALLVKEGMITKKEVQALIGRIESRIDEAIEFALQSPFPEASDLVKEV